MLRSLKELYEYTILATDGEIGVVDDFYFDQMIGGQLWTIRYLVIDTRMWLAGRRVLVSTLALGQPDRVDWASHRLPMRLTREQVENSPEVDLTRPISRQKEREVHEYYGWPIYWAGSKTPEVSQADAELRSTKQLTGYHVQDREDEIGLVEDFVVDDENWIIPYLVVDTRNWLPGRSVLVAPGWIEEVNWTEAKVQVDLHRESIKNSPEYDPVAPVKNRLYEETLYDHYGRPKYWSGH
jgi:hypothetical protein